MKRFWLVAAFFIALSARAPAGQIDVGTSVVSGEIILFESQEGSSHASLSAIQIQQLSQWLELHRSGWNGMITEATAEPTKLAARLQHVDGSVTTLSVIARSSGGYYLRLTGPKMWAYRSPGGVFKSWAAMRTLSGQELAAIKSMIETS